MLTPPVSHESPTCSGTALKITNGFFLRGNREAKRCSSQLTDRNPPRWQPAPAQETKGPLVHLSSLCCSWGLSHGAYLIPSARCDGAEQADIITQGEWLAGSAAPGNTGNKSSLSSGSSLGDFPFLSSKLAAQRRREDLGARAGSQECTYLLVWLPPAVRFFQDIKEAFKALEKHYPDLIRWNF